MNNSEKESPPSKPDISEEMVSKWQIIANLMARIVGVPAGLIMKVDQPQIEVLVASATEGNPYKQGERADLNTGLYCETVMKQRSPLLVPDALKDPDWDHNPDIRLGMISYLGFSIQWPDGEVFGTICVLDSKENQYSKTHVELISQFKELVEAHLSLLYAREHLEDQVDERTAELKDAMEQLEQSEERFRAFMDNNPTVMYLKNNEGRHIYGNKTLLKYFNLKPDSFIGTTNHDIFPSEIADHLYEVDRIVRAEKKVVELKDWCEIRGDEERWWKEIKFPVQSNKGEIFVGGIAINITELKQGEENYKKQLQFEKLISKLSAEFINLPFDQINAKIDESLKRIVEAIDIDRVILYQFSNEKQQLRLSHHFLKPAVQKPESVIANKDQPGFAKTILNNKILKVERVADLSKEYEPERKYLMQQGVKSGLAIPLTVGKKPVGALTFTTVFHERSWTDQDVKQLQIISEVFANALDRKYKEQKLRKAFDEIDKRLQFEKLISKLSAEFINLNPDQIDQEIDAGLKLISEYLGIERIALLQFSRDKSQLNLTHTYAIDSRQRAPIFSVSEQLPWFSESLRRGKTLRISKIGEMPEEAVAEKQYAKEQGFKAFLTIPMKVAGLTIGAISYSDMKSERTWPDDLVQRFKLVGQIFANALGRKQKEQNLQNALSEIQKLKDKLQQENIYLRQEIELKHKYGEIVGKSNTIKYVLSQAEQVAETDSTVLILGETGTGKELLARAIHNLSPRKDRPMIKVNCATLPATLIESELFGRGKGAYTGALSSQIGRFEMADGSTIFLDEISEMPLELQAKLLRVLQEGEFERLGDPRTINVNVRVIASTNRNLAKRIEQGSFREDLYYRLNVFPITIPPLSERKEDIPLLVWRFAKQFNTTMGKKIDHIANKDMDALMRYQWPGNIRELKNIIERAMILCQDSTLRIKLPGQSESKASQSMILAEIEKRHIVNTLNSINWRVGGKNGAAEILGLKRTTLLTKMKKLNIQRPKD